MNRKGFAAIFIIVIVAVAAALGGWYYVKKSSVPALNGAEGLQSVTSTATQDSSYKTVAQAEEGLGFQFTLPPGWKGAPISIDEPDVQWAIRYESSGGGKSFTLAIFSGVDPNKTTLAKWAKQDAVKHDNQTKEQLFVKVGSNFGPVYSGEVNGKIYKRYYLIRGIQEQIYRISVEMDKNNSWMSDFDKIVSTFKFVESKLSSPKTYKNIQFAFELTYPSTWSARGQSDGVLLRNYYNPTLDLPTNPRDITISVMQNKNPKKLNLQDWLATDPFWTTFSKSKQSLKIDDHEAIKIYYEEPSPAYKDVIDKKYNYFIARDTDVFLSGYLSKDGNPDSIFDQVIQSIKFIPFDQSAYKQTIDSETQKIIGDDKDADNNGVWDRVDQYINKNYASSAKIRAGLTQYAKALIQVLIDNRDENKTIANVRKQLGTLDCMSYITANGKETINTIEKASKLTKDIESQIVNNEDRFLADNNANGQFGGQGWDLRESEYKAQCDFDPDKLPN